MVTIIYNTYIRGQMIEYEQISQKYKMMNAMIDCEETIKVGPCVKDEVARLYVPRMHVYLLLRCISARA